MSGQQIGAGIGLVVGAYFGAPQLGMAIGGMIGGWVDPTRINGPHIGDGQQQSATDGAPIAWVMGTATIAGTVVQVGPRREVKIKDSGKGSGTVVSHYEARQDFAILICESSSLRNSTIQQVLMVEQDGKIVYDVRPGSTIAEDSAKWKANVDFLFGDENQMPHATLEAITGVGNTPAYRGSCLAVFKDFDVSQAGDRIPQFRFTVTSSAVTATTFPGGQSYPYTNDITVPSEAGSYTLLYTTGYVPDKFQVVINGTVVADSGYHGDVSYQSQLNAALASYSAPPETITQYPYASPATVDADTQWASPDKRESLVFSKPDGVTTVTVEAWAPMSGTAWDYALLPPIGAALPLSTIVSNICSRGGLSASEIDVSPLSSVLVSGYPIARQSTAADCLLPLLQAYFAYGSDYDGKLNFAFYGQDANITVSRDDLLVDANANDGNITETKRDQATEYPRKITASYYDPAQNYMVVNVSAERLATDVIAIGEQTLQIPVVMDADSAAQAADRALKVAYATLEGTRDYSVPFAQSANYLTVCAGEPVLMDGKRWVADKLTLGDGSVAFSTRYDRQSAYTSSVQAILGNAPTTPSSRYSGPTTLIPMNLPSLRPQDTYGIYLAAASQTGSSNWKGCTVQVSYDGQASWQNAVTITSGSTLGTITVAEPAGGEPLTVDTGGTGDLESVTSAQLAAQMNAFALVNGDTAEIGQFQTATQQPDGTYQITTISRGLLGTTEVPATAGQPFTMLDSVYFLPIDISFAGTTIAFRAVGFNEVAEDQPVETITYNPDTTIIIDGGGAP